LIFHEVNPGRTFRSPFRTATFESGSYGRYWFANSASRFSIPAAVDAAGAAARFGFAGVSPIAASDRARSAAPLLYLFIPFILSCLLVISSDPAADDVQRLDDCGLIRLQSERPLEERDRLLPPAETGLKEAEAFRVSVSGCRSPASRVPSRRRGGAREAPRPAGYFARGNVSMPSRGAIPNCVRPRGGRTPINTFIDNWNRNPTLFV
jgi:hypothetical protein